MANQRFSASMPMERVMANQRFSDGESAVQRFNAESAPCAIGTLF